MPRGVRPGGVVERRVKPPFERMTNDPRRPVEDLDRAILEALADEPLAKWELRDRLHEPEHAVYKRLQALRDEGVVKPVGKRLAQRRWALASWQQPAPPVHRTTFEDESTAVAARKPKPSTDSWWAKHAAPEAREDFMRAAATRNAEDSTPAWRSQGRVTQNR
jgi:DNA-binding Lrp family transcriptional regulator